MITRRGSYFDEAGSTFELFQGDARFQPARWPRQGYSRGIRKGPSADTIAVTPDIYARFGREPFLWIGGYWAADWAYETVPVEATDANLSAFTIPKRKSPGETRDGFPFFLFNAFAALAEPGDYVFDADAKVVYAAATVDTDIFEVGTEQTLLEITNANGLRLENLQLEKSLGTSLKIRNSTNVTIDGCRIRHSGGGAILVEGGSGVVISRCLIQDTAETAVHLTGGTRRDLVPAGHAIVDSVIKGFSRDARTRSAVQLTGVGLRVERNLIEDGPHAAIVVQGNDHVIRGNKIHDVVQETDDAGAIYAGRDWTERGTTIDGNWFSEIGMSDGPRAGSAIGRKFVSGIYLDDQESGYRISSNVFDRVARPVVIHGGRDNLVTGNAFLRCEYSGIWLERRGEGLTGGELNQRLSAMPYREPPWSVRYPALATIQENQPAEPLGNQEEHNTAVGCTLFSFGRSTSPNFWPSIGANSRQIAAPETAGYATVDVLKRAGLNCDTYPIVCQ